MLFLHFWVCCCIKFHLTLLDQRLWGIFLLASISWLYVRYFFFFFLLTQLTFLVSSFILFSFLHFGSKLDSWNWFVYICLNTEMPSFYSQERYNFYGLLFHGLSSWKSRNRIMSITTSQRNLNQFPLSSFILKTFIIHNSSIDWFGISLIQKYCLAYMLSRCQTTVILRLLGNFRSRIF